MDKDYVLACKMDDDGEAMGRANGNPILDSAAYQIVGYYTCSLGLKLKIVKQ